MGENIKMTMLALTLLGVITIIYMGSVKFKQDQSQGQTV